jgi:hypothetical protein
MNKQTIVLYLFLSCCTTSSVAQYLVIQGKVQDGQKNPLPYTSIGIVGKSQGTSSNADGEFELKIAPSFIKDTLSFSYIGYASHKVVIADIDTSKAFIVTLLADTVLLDEVLVASIPAVELVKKAIQLVPQNYSALPTYLNTFYREYLHYKLDFETDKIDTQNRLREALLKIYKQPYDKDVKKRAKEEDLIKLIKWREIGEIKDTNVSKLSGSGANNLLQNDFAKNPEIFIDKNINKYDFNYHSITTYNGRKTIVIHFDQNEKAKKLLFEGEIMIDDSSYAIAGIRYKLSEKGSKKYDISRTILFIDASISSYSCEINYQYWNNTWHLQRVTSNYVGNILIRKTWLSKMIMKDAFEEGKDELFTQLNGYGEMITTSIETENVTPFPKEEIFKRKSKADYQGTQLEQKDENYIKMPAFMRKRLEKEIQKEIEKEEKKQEQEIEG